MEDSQTVVSLDEYDCIGFDLDNTLVQYYEFELVSLIYDISAEYLVERKHYAPEDLLIPITSDIDFIRKGLTLDTERGNVLSLAEDGSILRACHGTRPLSANDIERVYGPGGKWNLAEEHCNNFLCTWNGELSDLIRSSLDYFDMSVPLLFARIVDALDKRQTDIKKYDFWATILEAVMYVYRTDSFIDNSGEYYRAVRANPYKYLRKCSQNFLRWLDSLKTAGKTTFLITGSKDDYATFIAEHALAENWTKYFDVIVFFAKKPGFFFQARPFQPCDAVDNSLELKVDSCYSEGNWNDLYKLFAKVTNKNEPKCLYIGDNLIQDVYTPAKHKCCDTIAVVKELSVEEDEKNELFHSETWGSFIYDRKNNKYTIWGRVIKNYSKACIPSIEWFVDQSLRKNYAQLQY